MKTIIAEKPSVAKEIARIVGATKREEGYLTGNGYNVTWAFGHLVQLALPEGYGIKGFNRDSLPVLPEEFKLVARQVKTGNGYKADAGVMKQIRIISKLFKEIDQIIVATDAGREGELIFRYLYAFTDTNVSFVRLWISSLTDKAIREGLKSLKDGSEYDNLYQSAKARSEADWLVGINGTQALSVAAGRGTYSVGRVQTPTLAMVCSRYWENKRFQPVPFWQIYFGTKGTDGEVLKFTSIEKWQDKTTATDLYNKVKELRTATVTKVECKTVHQEPPLLFDLTSLQKEANSRHGFTAEQTLSIAQKLYEAKLITYPRTSSRYIPYDVFAEMPFLLEKLTGHPTFGRNIRTLGKLNSRSVDAEKVTDHHALLITTHKPIGLYKDEQTIYDMILGRMVEAFSKECVKDTTSVKAECGGVEFVIKGGIIRQAGWRDVYKEAEEEPVLPNWYEGQEISLSGCSLSESKTKPKPLHTESTLLAAMENPCQREQSRTCSDMPSAAGFGETQTAGKDIVDEAMRQALKDCGIGTPATRAAIIETLIKREYMVRQKKTLVPTEKGLALYSVVKDMAISNVELTGKWEAELAKIEKGESIPEAFMHDIESYTRQITTELLSCDKLFGHKASACTCPKCGKGTMQFYGKVVRCDNADCAMPVFRQIAGRILTDSEMTDLLTKGRTELLKGFKSKQGKAFSAIVTFDADFNTKFIFPEAKGTEKRRNMCRSKK